MKRLKGQDTYLKYDKIIHCLEDGQKHFIVMMSDYIVNFNLDAMVTNTVVPSEEQYNDLKCLIMSKKDIRSDMSSARLTKLDALLKHCMAEEMKVMDC